MSAPRQPIGLISRVADSCMWFGRYVERSESTARVLQATLSLALDGELSPRRAWHSAVIVAGVEKDVLERFGDGALDDGELIQRHVTWERELPASLCRSVAAARENARAMRDVLSSEVWEAINELHLWLSGESAPRIWQLRRDDFYRRVRHATQLCLGLLRSTMLHDTALDFVWLGMLLERVGQSARLLDVHHHALATDDGQAHHVVETAVWVALLRACSGVEPFMKTHAGRVSGRRVASFLFGESRFPRSIAYCAHSAYARLCAIRPPEHGELPGGASVDRLRAFDGWVAERAAGLAHDFDRASLHQILTHVVDESAAICDTIGTEFLGYGPPAPAPPAPDAPQTQSQECLTS